LGSGGVTIRNGGREADILGSGGVTIRSGGREAVLGADVCLRGVTTFIGGVELKEGIEKDGLVLLRLLGCGKDELGRLGDEL